MDFKNLERAEVLIKGVWAKYTDKKLISQFSLDFQAGYFSAHVYDCYIKNSSIFISRDNVTTIVRRLLGIIKNEKSLIS